VEVARETDDPFFTSGAVLQLGLWATEQGDLGQAEALLEEARGLSSEAGEIGGIAEALDALARLAIRRGAFSRAKELALEALRLAEEIGDRLGITSVVGTVAEVAVGEGAGDRAARLVGAIEAEWSEIGFSLLPQERDWMNRILEAGRAQIGDKAWVRAWEDGRGMPLDLATALARECASASAEVSGMPNMEQSPDKTS
jgi:tetratricopeptide (TPR) repeat protein